MSNKTYFKRVYQDEPDYVNFVIDGKSFVVDIHDAKTVEDTLIFLGYRYKDIWEGVTDGIVV